MSLKRILVFAVSTFLFFTNNPLAIANHCFKDTAKKIFNDKSLWNPDRPGYEKYYNKAVEMLSRGETYDAPYVEILGGNSDEVMQAFVNISFKWDQYIPRVIAEVKKVSNGKAILEPIEANQSPINYMGMSKYFKLTLSTPDGVQTRTAILAQNGFHVLREAPRAKKVATAISDSSHLASAQEILKKSIAHPESRSVPAQAVKPPENRIEHHSVEAKDYTPWNPEKPGYEKYYEEAVNALSKGETYDAPLVDDLGGNGDAAMRAFVNISFKWETYVPRLIEEVKKSSHGKVVLEPIDVKQSPVGVMGMARYFKMTINSPSGIEIKTVILAQNGFEVINKPPLH